MNEMDPPEPELMREAGRIAGEAHDYLASMLGVGQSTAFLDEQAEQFIRDHAADPAFFDYQDGDHAITVSINDEVVHAPPSPDKVIEDGDIVSIDLGAKVEGHYSDTAVSHIVGDPRSPKHEFLVEQAKSALYAGILQAIAGNTLRDIGEAIENETREFGNVTKYAGHFIGRRLHLKPQIHNTAEQNESFQLQRGMFLAIEPILTLTDNADTMEQYPERAVRTRSGAPGAHFEHTVRVGKDRAEILTSRSAEPDRL